VQSITRRLFSCSTFLTCLFLNNSFSFDDCFLLTSIVIARVSCRCKGDASLTFEDPNAASAAASFFTGTELPQHPGFKMTVCLADTKDDDASGDPYGGGGGGGYGGGGGGYGGKGDYGGGGKGGGYGKGKGDYGKGGGKGGYGGGKGGGGRESGSFGGGRDERRSDYNSRY